MVVQVFQVSHARAKHRECRKCAVEQPIDQFPEYIKRGRVYRRHVCSGCMMAVVTEWKARERQQRYQERRTILRSIVWSMIGDGMTRQEIARYAGLSRQTVSRILNGSGGRVQFQEPTEARILALYSEVKGAAA